MLRRIFDHKNIYENNEYKQRTNAELMEAINEPDIVYCVLENRIFSWVGRVQRVEDMISK